MVKCGQLLGNIFFCNFLNFSGFSSLNEYLLRHFLIDYIFLVIFFLIDRPVQS